MKTSATAQLLPSLNEARDRIIECHSAWLQSKDHVLAVGKVGIAAAIEAGGLLLGVKASLKHGRFLPWIKSNLPLDARTCQRWMRLYEKREELKYDSLSYLTDAYAQTEGGNGKDVIATKFTGDPENYTPSEYIEAVRSVMGGIDLDPASNGFAQKTVKAKTFYTEKEDGLEQEWTGRVFLNPPYNSGVIDRFVEKLVSTFESHNGIKSAILLTNDNTDTAWFHRAANRASAICLLRGRINFYKEDGPPTSPTNGQTFFYFGNETAKFRKVFGAFGLIVRVI